MAFRSSISSFSVSAAQAEAQRSRIQKEIDQIEKVIASSERQLGDEKFVSRAPAHVVEHDYGKAGRISSAASKAQRVVEWQPLSPAIGTILTSVP